MGRRFVIFGAGAIGGVVGALFARADEDVVLIARGEHAARMQTDGLALEHGDERDVLFPTVVTSVNDIAWREDDVVLLSVKSQDTQDAVRSLALVAPPSILVVCAQNGVDNERVVLRHFRNTYGAVVMMPAGHLSPGVVQSHAWPTPGLIDVGCYPSGSDQGAREVVEALNRIGFNCVVRDDVMRWKYTKLLMNLANSVIALCGFGKEEAAELRAAARDEGVAVLNAAGIEYASDEEDRARRADTLKLVPIGGKTRTGGSTWQSLARGTGTIETDWLNGEIVALGRVHRVATPVNEVLQRLTNQAARDGLAPESMDAREILASL
ncbi:MAG: 2-dehydropantoate 2-reductase [Acidimicrobiales bacterium]|nr:2-dehydropantoate 2-reductase [Acidimicrobiales bacterium]